MKQRNEILLLLSVILYDLYIVILNTSTLHGLKIPDRTIWTGILLIPLVYISYSIFKQSADQIFEKILYFAIILGIGGSIMILFGISVQFLSYKLMLILSATLTVAAMFFHPSNRIRYLTFIYSIGTIILVFRLFVLSKALTKFLPFVELFIVIGILYYNYRVGVSLDELFVIIIFTVLGFYFGKFLTNFDVISLILGTLFDQTLSLGQYTLTVQIGKLYIGTFNSGFFLALHIAEIFNILMLQLIMRRSTTAMAIIITGIDMTYPPLLVFRSMLILLLMRRTLNPTLLNE